MEPKITRSAKMDLCTAANTFYGLEYLKGLRTSPNNSAILNKRIRDIRHDAENFQKDFSSNLAKTLHDYLCVISLGEARHATTKCVYVPAKIHHWLSIVNNTDTGTGGRDHLYNSASHYNPDLFLPELYDLFSNRWQIDNSSHSSNFGGWKWAEIVRKASLYGKMSNVMFVDMVINTAHNGSLCFDKSVLIWCNVENLKFFLDLRANSDSFMSAYYSKMNPFYVSILAISIFETYAALQLERVCLEEIPLSMPTVKWGSLALTDELLWEIIPNENAI